MKRDGKVVWMFAFLFVLLLISGCGFLTGLSVKEKNLCGNNVTDSGENCQTCSQDVSVKETCDSVDNDCDVKIDEGNVCNTAYHCGSYGQPCAEGQPCYFGVCGNPKVLLSFDETKGDVALDGSGNNQNASLVNLPVRTNDSCVSGSCLFLDNEDDYIRFPEQPVASLFGSQFSLSFWAKGGSVQNRPTFGFLDSGKYNQQNPLVSYDEAISLGNGKLGSSGYQLFYYNLPKTLQNTWTHYAFVDNGTQYLIYINGVRDFMTDVKVSPASSSNRTFVLGNTGFEGDHNDDFNGYLDEFLVYDRSLSLLEIKNLYESGE